MFLRKTFLLFVSMVALCATMEAKTTTLVAADNGVLGAMNRVGCHNSRWLASVMQASNILEGQLNKLPKGTSIVVPDECESNQRPAEEDVRTTRRILAHQHELLGLVKTSKSIHVELSKPTESISVKPVVASSKSPSVAVVSTTSVKKNSTTAISSRELIIYFTFIIIVLLLAAVAVLEFFLYVRPLKRQVESLKLFSPEALMPKGNVSRGQGGARSIEFHGVTQIFSDSSEYRVKCPHPHCRERRISPYAENMKQHLMTHTDLRVIEISVEEANQLLAQSA